MFRCCQGQSCCVTRQCMPRWTIISTNSRVVGMLSKIYICVFCLPNFPNILANNHFTWLQWPVGKELCCMKNSQVFIGTPCIWRITARKSVIVCICCKIVGFSTSLLFIYGSFQVQCTCGAKPGKRAMQRCIQSRYTIYPVGILEALAAGMACSAPFGIVHVRVLS